jgi:hypothetical protein
MIIPPGLTENDVLEVIDDIAAKLSPKLAFGIHTMEDIRQEGRILALRGLEKFNHTLFTAEGMKQGLENFLRVHVNKRIRNHKRDNLGRTEKPVNPARIAAWEQRNKIRHNLMNPLDISEISYDIFLRDDVVEDAHYSQLIELIKRELSPELRSDFLRMCDGVRIPKGRQSKVRAALIEIMNMKGEVDDAPPSEVRD